MANEKTEGINALGAAAAYNLANVTKTKPQFASLTPKWLTKFLEFKGLETGIFRVNKVVEGETPLDVLCKNPGKLLLFRHPNLPEKTCFLDTCSELKLVPQLAWRKNTLLRYIFRVFKGVEETMRCIE